MTDIDPALAHLYAETGTEDDDEELALLKAAAASSLSLEELTAAEDLAEEELSDHDLEELALLVGSRVWGPDGLPDEDAAELGLGDLEPDGELVLNTVGRKVLRILVEKFSRDEVGPDA